MEDTGFSAGDRLAWHRPAPNPPPLVGVMGEKQQAGPGWGARGH